MINKYKIHRIVEYIKQFDFDFETFDILEDLDMVLAYYDLLEVELNNRECDLLAYELLKLAEQYEFRESAYLASQNDLLITQIPGRRFSLKQEAIERKLTGTYSHTSALELARKLSLA